VLLLIVLYKVVLAFDPVDEILKCDFFFSFDHSNESFTAVIPHGTVRFSIFYKIILNKLSLFLSEGS